MTTVAAILEQVRDNLDEPSEGQWLDAQLRRWLNAGVDELARDARFDEQQADIAVSIGTQEVTIPADVLVIQHAYFLPTGDNRQIPLTAYHYEQMDNIWGHWQNQTTGDPECFAPRGLAPNLKVFLYPVPDRAGTLRVFYTGRPTPIADDGSDDANQVSIPSAWDDALVHYIEFRALRKDRDPRYQEAFALFVETRESLKESDVLEQARTVVHDGNLGGMPRWLVDPAFD